MKARSPAPVPGASPDTHEAVAYADLLSRAHEEGLKGIQTQLLLTPTEENGRLANAYLGCPLKYRFQYVDKIPRPWRVAAMAFGSSVHAAVEWFHRERLAGRIPDLAEVLKVFDADWYAQNVEPLVFSERESKDSFADKGRAMLQLYVESPNGAKPVAVEQWFELDLADPETGEDGPARRVVLTAAAPPCSFPARSFHFHRGSTRSRLEPFFLPAPVGDWTCMSAN